MIELFMNKMVTVKISTIRSLDRAISRASVAKFKTLPALKMKHTTGSFQRLTHNPPPQLSRHKILTKLNLSSQSLAVQSAGQMS